jgi:IclR family acetate operon transcriptional repressor
MDAAAVDSTTGASRVLAVLMELAQHPNGASLSELADRLAQPRSSVHRALGTLVKSGLVAKAGRGHYILGDEFLRLAFAHYAARPDFQRVMPTLERLAREFGETAHYAVLQGRDVVYRAKVDPPIGAVHLTSTVGGSNPAHSTAVGKLLLSYSLRSRADVEAWMGDDRLEPRTPATKLTAEELAADLERIRLRGFATDEEENEPGVNCIAFPVYYASSNPEGAVSISAISYRTPHERLLAMAGAIAEMIPERLPTSYRLPREKEH